MKKTHLKRSSLLKSKSTLKRTSFDTKLIPNKPQNFRNKSEKTGKRRQSHGLVGHGRSRYDIQLHSNIVSTGCFVCRHLGLKTTHRLCIHHVDGRFNGKVDDLSESLVLCLCSIHHDPSAVCGASPSDFPSAHGNKKQFIRQVGTEMWCVHQTYKLLRACPPWLDGSAWDNYCSLNSYDCEHSWIVNYETTHRGYKPFQSA